MRLLIRLASAVPAATLLLSLAVAPALAAPTTRYVDDDGHASTGAGCSGSNAVPTTLQGGVDASSPGDTIIVCPGTYVGTVTVTTANLTIKSSTKWKAIIVPATNHVSNTALVFLNASGDKFNGFEVLVPTEGTCEYVSEMVLVRDAPHDTVKGNKIGITGHHGQGACGYVSGVGVDGASGGSQVLANRITDFQGHGVSELSTGTVLVKDNIIKYNHSGNPVGSNSSSGIYDFPSSGGTAQLRHNTISSLSSGGTTTPRLAYGIVTYGDHTDVRSNHASNVDTFIYEDSSTSGLISNNVGTTNTRHGLDMSNSSNIEITGNTVGGTEVGVQIDSGSNSNNFHDNDWRGAAAPDCLDPSTGGGTAGTKNTWVRNRGTGTPPGICAP